MKNVLVLGITGMLGSMIFRYLSLNKSLKVSGSIRNFQGENHKKIFNLDASDFTETNLLKLIDKTNPDYIINCIGIINKYCSSDNHPGVQNAILINSLFPHRLAYYTYKYSPETQIIQIATDCVYSGLKGNYSENDVHDPLDIYGKSKSLGEVECNNFINIRCSIIGPEINNKSSLLEWFLSRDCNETIEGYNHHYWNGVTTLQFAQFCEKIIMEESFEALRNLNPALHYCPNELVSKYQLLMIFKEVFNKNVHIKKVDDVKKIDRTLVSGFLKNENRSMYDSVAELNRFMSSINYYK